MKVAGVAFYMCLLEYGMSQEDYIKQLEEENEQLRKKLEEAVSSYENLNNSEEALRKRIQELQKADTVKSSEKNNDIIKKFEEMFRNFTNAKSK